jgi:hypothetical protein
MTLVDTNVLLDIATDDPRRSPHELSDMWDDYPGCCGLATPLIRATFADFSLGRCPPTASNEPTDNSSDGAHIT